MGAVPGGPPGQPVGHQHRRVLVRAAAGSAPPGRPAARVLLDRDRRRGPLPLGDHGVAVGLGNHLLHLGQHVVADHGKLARVGPHRLVLRQRHGDKAVALLPPAFTQDPDMPLDGRGLMRLLDLLVDRSGRRLVAGDPLLSATHLSITQPELTTQPGSQSTPRWSTTPRCAGRSGGPADQHARLREDQRQVVVQAAPGMVQQPGNQPVERGAQR
jgi:hypothetical protein